MHRPAKIYYKEHLKDKINTTLRAGIDKWQEEVHQGRLPQPAKMRSASNDGGLLTGNQKNRLSIKPP